MITAGGWAAAAIAALSAWIAWRLLSSRMDSVARACHELRGPITAARLGLELGARPGALSSARLRALDLELGRAALAIDDLANVRALRRRPQPWEEVDLAELLTDSIEAWRPSAAARGVSLALQPPVAPVLVLGHRLRLAQATGNLLANAIEHGGGAVEVRLRADVTRVRAEFADDGPGLPAPVAELVRRGRRRRGPHGHGLAVATAVAIEHGGRLAGAPSDGGARLVLELPVVPHSLKNSSLASP